MNFLSWWLNWGGYLKEIKKCVLDEVTRMFTMILNYIAYFYSEWMIETFEIRFFLPNLSKMSNILVNSYNIRITAIQSWIFLTIFFKFQYDASNHYPRKDQLLWIDMPWYSRLLHIIKQIPCYILLFLFPFFSSCCPWSRDVSILIYSLIFYTDVILSCLVIFFIFAVR